MDRMSLTGLWEPRAYVGHRQPALWTRGLLTGRPGRSRGVERLSET